VARRLPLGLAGLEENMQKIETASPAWIVFALALAACSADEPASATSGAQALGASYRYRYVSLDEARPPGAIFVDYFGLAADGRAFGTAYVCDEITCSPSVVVHQRGTTTVLHAGAEGRAVNASGTVAGAVVTDPENFTMQAALIRPTGVELVPALPGEQMSVAFRISDSGHALVESWGLEGYTLSLHHQGRSTILDLGDGFAGFLDVGADGLVTGTFFSPEPMRAFRHDPKTGTTTLLHPLASEPHSWGQAVNGRGAVLGYSFIPGGLERIGFWDRQGTFHESFVQGTPEVPTVSNRLYWNEAGLIVVTASHNDPNSYIVPAPGVRVNLADITEGPLPAAITIADVNDRGDLLGWGGSEPFTFEHSFILERI
jgi:hypothetical protein